MKISNSENNFLLSIIYYKNEHNTCAISYAIGGSNTIGSIDNKPRGWVGKCVLDVMSTWSRYVSTVVKIWKGHCQGRNFPGEGGIETK